MQAELCKLTDIDDPGARAFELENRSIFIVRQGSDVQGYINSCPHRGVRLEWQPDQFLDYEKQYIQCSTHGALFKISDGLCVVGPCNGQRLEAIECQVIAGSVMINQPD